MDQKTKCFSRLLKELPCVHNTNRITCKTNPEFVQFQIQVSGKYFRTEGDDGVEADPNATAGIATPPPIASSNIRG